jgi:hypothetical protein
MKSFNNYWTFNTIRGAMTLLAAVAIAAVPRAAAAMLSIPLLIGFSIACYATYIFSDAPVMILLAKLLPQTVTGRKVLYPQAVIGALIGTLLFLIAYDVLPLSWLMGLAAAQAAVAAAAEFLVARSTHRQYGCLSCYSSVIVLAASAIALPFASRLDPAGMSLALATYVALFGASELTVGARMLFLEYRAEHPAPEFLSQEWRAAMQPANLPAAAVLAPTAATRIDCIASLSCDACPAETACRDNSLQTKIAAILATRQPAIVNTIRAATLLHQH